MYYPMYFDPTYVLVLIGVVICMIASAKMNSTFNRKRGCGDNPEEGWYL